MNALIDQTITYDASTLASHTLSTYAYDASAMRVAKTVQVDVNNDGDFVDPGDTSSQTEYVVDRNNHTSLPYVLEEVDGASGDVIKSYTIGQDVMAEAVAAGMRHLLKDARGGVRMLLTDSGLIVVNDMGTPGDTSDDVLQVFDYDAYGNALNFDPATALTSLLYNGQQFDPATGLQYLRARYYDPTMGRFTQLDPFSGNLNDPRSLHRYAYTSGDPILFGDPTGLFEGLVGLLTNLSIGQNNNAKHLAAVMKAKGYAENAVDFLFFAQKVLEVVASSGGVSWMGIVEILIESAVGQLDEIKDQMKDALMDSDTLESLMTGVAASAAPMIRFEIDLPERKKKGRGFTKKPNKITAGLQLASKYFANSKNAQEWLGELGTSLVMSLMGFKDGGLERAHKKWGFDGVLRHNSLDELWAIFEAKGGTSRLGKSGLTGVRPGPEGMEQRLRTGTKYPQMGTHWIEYWSRLWMRENERSEAGKDFGKAFKAGTPMLTAVVSLNLKRQENEIRGAIQFFVPQKGNGFDDWPRHFG